MNDKQPPPDPIQLSEDTFEIPCFWCNEPLIVQVGDDIQIRVEEDGEAHPICTRCYGAKRKSK